jgi:hypothetical protein
MTDDDELMEHLRRIANEVDPVPDLVTTSARAAFSTRRLDDELAELLADSYATTATDVRLEQPGPRLVSFAAGGVSLELQIEQVPDGLLLHGMAIGTVGDAEVETATTGAHPVPIDEQGWFRDEALPVGPLRVRVRAADGPAVTTGWIRP